MTPPSIKEIAEALMLNPENAGVIVCVFRNNGTFDAALLLETEQRSNLPFMAQKLRDMATGLERMITEAAPEDDISFPG